MLTVTQSLLNLLTTKVGTLEEKVATLEPLADELQAAAVALAIRVLALEGQVLELETGASVSPDPEALAKLLNEAGDAVLAESGETIPLEGN